MRTTKLERAIKDAVEQDILSAIADVGLDRYINSKQISIWVKDAIQDHVARRVSEDMEAKIFKAIHKYDGQLDQEIQRLVFEEVSKHIKV